MRTAGLSARVVTVGIWCWQWSRLILGSSGYGIAHAGSGVFVLLEVQVKKCLFGLNANVNFVKLPPCAPVTITIAVIYIG